MKFILNIVLAIACVSHIAINAYYALYPDMVGWNGDFENGSSLTVKGIKTRQSISGSVLKRDQRETKDRPETDLGDRQTKNIKIVSSRKVFIRKSNTSIS